MSAYMSETDSTDFSGTESESETSEMSETSADDMLMKQIKTQALRDTNSKSDTFTKMLEINNKNINRNGF